jgi:hypothetical protein
VILELAREAGAPLYEPHTGSAWDCFPTAGRVELIKAVTGAGELHFGQLHLTPTEIYVLGDENPPKAINSPSLLRAAIRDNPFRSLATSTDLPGGWRVVIDNPVQLHAVVEIVYPGAAADWAAHRTGTFITNTFAYTIQRQVGDYRVLVSLDSAQQERVVKRLCGGCVRHPTWFCGGSPTNAIPCPEPCNQWLSAALEETT